MLTVFGSYPGINILKGVNANTSNNLKFIGADPDDHWLDFPSYTLHKGYAVLLTPRAKGIQVPWVHVLSFADSPPVISESATKALCKQNGMQQLLYTV